MNQVDYDDFARAIAANRADTGLRGVFADFLDEHGRHEEAAYHRRWTPEVGAAEDWLAKFAGEAGLGYDELVRACRRYWQQGVEYGTGMNFSPGNVLAFGLGSETTPSYDFDGGVTRVELWRCVGLLYGDEVPEARRQEPFICCEWDEDLGDELAPYPTGGAAKNSAGNDFADWWDGETPDKDIP
jgi:uncharacterized protein (TIGR02996 family)